MQFLPKGAMNNVVPIYHYVNEANGLRRIKVGSAWKRRRQMTMRIDIYRDRMHEYETYRTSDGQLFLPLLIPMQEFLDLGTRETEMAYAETNTDEDDMELVGYIRASSSKESQGLFERRQHPGIHGTQQLRKQHVRRGAHELDQGHRGRAPVGGSRQHQERTPRCRRDEDAVPHQPIVR